MTHPLFDPGSRLVIAHRGNSAHAPENTIEAIQSAVELGADAVEFDVRLTRDGVPVLLHDATLDRTTSGRGRLSDCDMTQVRGLDASRGLSQWTGPRAAVPTLEEVLDRFRATPAVIEIKEPDAVEPTVRLIHRLGLQGHIVAGSDDLEVMARLNRSGLRTIASRTDAMLLVPLALVGIAPRAPRYDVLSITPRYFGWPIPVLRMTVAARERGIPTHVWTVNDPSGALAYWRGGVSGIVTDDPGAMLRARPR